MANTTPISLGPPHARPQTAEGKHNFSWAAAHPAGEQPSSADTLPESGGSFLDLLDVINPLQHIPLVGTLYRAITGDTLSEASRMFGGFLFGGPMGFLASAAGAIISETTGGDIGDHVLASLGSSQTEAKSAANAYAKASVLKI